MSLTITKQTSILDNIKLFETIDVLKLEQLIESEFLQTVKHWDDNYENEKDMLIKMRYKLQNNILPVTYKKCITGFGRINPVRSMSLCCVRRALRHTLCKGTYVDIDIKNCHPTILLQLCQKNNIECKYLAKYVNNREKYLKQVQDTYKVNRDKAKNLFIILAYFGSLKNWKEMNKVVSNETIKFLEKYITELQTIGKKIAEANPEIYEYIEKKNKAELERLMKNKKDNEKVKQKSTIGGVVSSVMQEFEHRILTTVFQHLLDTKVITDNAVLCYDGIMILKGSFTPSLLSELPTMVESKTGFKVEFTTKEMDEDLCELIKNIVVTKTYNSQFKTYDIDQRYIYDETNIELLTMFTSWYTSSSKVIAVKSAYGTGKTYFIDWLIEKYQPKRALFITYRQTLSYNLEGSFKKHKFGNYLNGDFRSDRIICQLESLNKLFVYNDFTKEFITPKFDLIILDENESLLNHLGASTISKKMNVFNVFDIIMKTANKVISLDGDFGVRSYEYLKTINKDDFTVVKNKNIPVVKTWNFTNNQDQFETSLINDLKDGKKIFVVSMSSDQGQKYVELLAELNLKVLLHCATSDDMLKKKLITVNDYWINYDCVIISPTVESGVDFNVKYFDRQYICLSQMSTSQRGLLQMTNRIRNLKDNNMPVFLNGLPFKSDANTFNLYDIEKMIKSELQNTEFEVNENGNLVISNSTYNNIYKHNKLELENKNSHCFITVLLTTLTEKGQKYEFDESKFSRRKNVHNFTKEKLLAVGDIAEETFNHLKRHIERNKATEEDKLQVERYYYKKHWDVKVFDKDFIDKAYKRTHILFNNKAINNLAVPNFESQDVEYLDIGKKEKALKLKYINQLLEMFEFKAEDNTFSDKVLSATEFETYKDNSLKKSKLFTNKEVLTMFGKRKQNLTSNKSFLGFVNSLLDNYGIKIKTVQVSDRDIKGNKQNTYKIIQTLI